MIFINTLIFAGIIGATSLSLASYKLYGYLEDRKVRAEYEKLLKSFEYNNSLVIDFPIRISNEYDSFRVIHFESIY